MSASVTQAVPLAARIGHRDRLERIVLDVGARRAVTSATGTSSSVTASARTSVATGASFGGGHVDRDGLGVGQGTRRSP